ncbi:MAG: hypothetical protein EPN75_14720 [Beijerinckiaceae bacterium]|nr:MAG: hypothetical protein EPN75_14720 [Beijerinckiaceae bacterium]
MLEAVSEADAASSPTDTMTPEVKVRPADNIFGFAPTRDAAASSQKPAQPQGAAPMEIKLQPADAIPGGAPSIDIEKTLTEKRPSFFSRLLRFVARTAAVACLCAVAWAAGAIYSKGHSPLFQLRQSPSHDAMASSMRQMSDEISALKASVDSKAVTQGAGAASPQSLANEANSAQATRTAIADLTSRIDKLQSDLTAGLSKVDERLAAIEQHNSTPHPAVASHARTAHKRPHHFHDAFDPSEHPSAVGAPRPLGATRW